MDGAFQRGDIIFRADVLGQFQHFHEHGRDKLGMGDAVFLDCGEIGLGIELFHDDKRRANPCERHVPA